MPTLYLTRGIPASTKSIYAYKWFNESPDTRALSNRDDLRDTLFPGQPSNHEREKIVTRVQQEQVRSALVAGLDVMIHDTNLAARFVKEWYKFSNDVRFVDFPISLENAIGNNSNRVMAGGRNVPEDVIVSYYRRYTPKGNLPKVPEREADAIPFPPYVYDPALPDAILVDIDGTLANHEGVRNPYDATRYHLDTVHADIAHLVDILTDAGYRIIVVSGRDDEYREVLVKWLIDNDIYVDEIHMRPTETGNKREDSIIKNELYETYIKGRYNVSYILDDRARVVQMWRSKGMRVLQVQPGEF